MAKLDFASGCLTLVAPAVATLSTNGTQVVADDVSAVGIPAIKEVVDGRLHSISDPPITGTMPAISADGRVASIRFDAPGYQLNIWDPATGKTTRLYKTRAELRRPQWGPDDSILLLRRDGPHTQLVSIDKGGTPHVMLPTPGARWMDLSSTGLVDVTNFSSTTTVYDLSTGGSHVIKGWYGMGWDSRGTTLVLAQKGGAFGLAAAPTFGSVSGVIQLPRGFVLGAAWLGRSARP